MAKKPTQQIALAQNFLKSSRLARLLLALTSITLFDTVYEIGPGRGTITAELARVARKVIAIEKDPLLVKRLCDRFQDVDNVQIIKGDFLLCRVADAEYKIFANIPYNITADIVRRILHVPPIPSEAYLIMQKEAAEKFSGSPKETQFSILAKPSFDIQIVRKLRRTDFKPAPNVDSVLLHIRKRSAPLIRGEDISLYRRFVRFGFGRWKKNLKLTFQPVFTHEQWKRLSRDLCFPLDVTPTELTFEQWLGLFDCFRHRVLTEKRAYLNR
ncbi:MAG TPA: 23S ribosomal RNA methyltransferase Erm [Anaerolineales bacterium]